MRNDRRTLDTGSDIGVTVASLGSTAGGGWLFSPPKGGEMGAASAPEWT